MRRRLIGMTLFLLAMCLMNGCSGSNSKQSQIDNSDEYVGVSLFCDVNFWEPPYWNITEGTITGDISRITGLALNITVPPQNADTKLRLMLLNNNLPDIISLTDSTTISQLITSGKVWKLDEFLREYCPESHLLTSFPEDIKEELIKRDGGWYALPSHINSTGAREIWKPNSVFYEELVTNKDNNAIIWNKNLLEQVGLNLEDLKTETQVLDALEKVKQMNLTVDGEPVIPVLVDGKDYQDPTIKFLACSFGAEYVDENGAYCDVIRKPEMKHALIYLNTMIRKGYVDPEQITLQNSRVKEYMASGRIFCFIGNVANSGIDARQWVSTGPILSSGGEYPVIGKNLRAPTGWIGTFISKSCENPEAVAKFIDYMSSEEGMMFWNYGYEGEGYQITKDGLVKRTEEGIEDSATYSQTGQGAWWMFSNVSWEHSVLLEPEKGDRIDAEKAIYTAFSKDKNTVIYDASLLTIPREVLSSGKEIDGIHTDINEYKKKQLSLLILSRSEQEFEQRYQEFIETLKKLGIEKLDELKDEVYRENCIKYGKQIDKVN